LEKFNTTGNSMIDKIAFEGDTYLQKAFIKIVSTFKPNLIIETGTHLGNTTQFLVKFKIPVMAIEKNEEFLTITTNAVKKCEYFDIFLGDSPTVLENNLDGLKNKKILAFLDAHWGGGMILQRELEFMAKLSIKPYLVIHDFHNPYHPEYGYDTHDNISYTFKNYEKYFKNIYGNNVIYRYNNKAEGSKQGVIFLDPQKEIT